MNTDLMPAAQQQVMVLRAASANRQGRGPCPSCAGVEHHVETAYVGGRGHVRFIVCSHCKLAVGEVQSVDDVLALRGVQ
jgi:hypothetical protein